MFECLHDLQMQHKDKQGRFVCRQHTRSCLTEHAPAKDAGRVIIVTLGVLHKAPPVHVTNVAARTGRKEERGVKGRRVSKVSNFCFCYWMSVMVINRPACRPKLAISRPRDLQAWKGREGVRV